MITEIEVLSERQTQFSDITATVQQVVSKARIKDGLAVLFVPHTTAGVTINENADPDVTFDMLNGLDRLVPLQQNYRHLEGNSAAHIKSSLIGVSEQILIRDGKLLLGTWQGIYFCDFDGPRKRNLLIKLMQG